MKKPPPKRKSSKKQKTRSSKGRPIRGDTPTRRNAELEAERCELPSDPINRETDYKFDPPASLTYFRSLKLH